ncbi:MAG: hypothetical protein ACR2PS_03150 [Pseudomonadales bacterium]
MSDSKSEAKRRHIKAELRNETYAVRQATKIWYEKPSASNPYIADEVFCHGYNLQELTAKKSFIEVLYLLFKGDLPSKAQASLLEWAFIAFINPGTRHPATRAAMQAAVGKTHFSHVLPIALTVMGGNFAAAGEVEPAMRFVLKNRNTAPNDLIGEYEGRSEVLLAPGVFPGFGSVYNGVDELTVATLAEFAEHESAGDCLAWARALSETLQPHGMGVLPTGLAAAIFCDLGFTPMAGVGLYQLMSAPGLLAHGLEYAKKPRTAVPFISDSNYVIEDE